MADQRDTYGATAKFTGFWVPPEHLMIVGIDCEADDCPDLADPDRLNIPVEDLALNVAAHGIKEPVVIKKYAHLDRPVVVAGRCRVRAARRANEILRERGDDRAIEVPCISDKSDAFTTMVLENEFRVNDSALASARKARRMMERGATDKEIATAFGRSVSAVRFWWKLLEASPAVQEAVKRGAITASVAVEIAKLRPSEQSDALREAVASGRGSATLDNVRSTRKAAKTGKPAAHRLPLKKVKAFTEQLGAIEEPEPEVEIAHAVMRAISGGGIAALQKWPNVANVFEAVAD